MKHTILILLLAACTIAANAQTASKPASSDKPATAATSAAKSAPDAKPAATPDKPIEHMTPLEGIHKTLFTITLGYQDIKIGTGAPAEPKKLLKCHFTVWLAADGAKFDSTEDHRSPVLDSDKKPVLDENGKPKMGDAQPFTMLMGGGRPLPGIDMGFEGMKVGGKRRVFIPWQLGFGDRELPARGPQPAVPAKSDLVVDLELLDVSEPPERPMHPSMSAPPHSAPGTTPKPAAPATPPAAVTKPAPPPPAK